jgi:hypothetical protein
MMTADALAASPFGLLDTHSSLRLVADAVHEDDALCLALTCRPLRDALWARFPRRARTFHGLFEDVSGRYPSKTCRVRTRAAAVAGTLPRLVWAWGLPFVDRPYWLQAYGGRSHRR